MLNRPWMEQLAWAAAFIEGEGNFYASRRNSILRVSAVQNTREPLEWLQSLFGGVIHDREITYRGRQRPLLDWTVSGSRAAGVAMTIYSYMTERRRGQIRAALDIWRSMRAHHRHWTHCKRGHLFTETNIYRGNKGERRCRQCILERSRTVDNAKRREAGRPMRAKLNEDQVREIRRRYAAGIGLQQLCADFGIKAPAMCSLVHGKTWRHVQ